RDRARRAGSTTQVEMQLFQTIGPIRRIGAVGVDFQLMQLELRLVELPRKSQSAGFIDDSAHLGRRWRHRHCRLIPVTRGSYGPRRLDIRNLGRIPSVGRRIYPTQPLANRGNAQRYSDPCQSNRGGRDQRECYAWAALFCLFEFANEVAAAAKA